MARLLPLSLLLLASRAFGWIQLTFEERCSTVMDMEPWDSASTSYTTETERWYPKTITKTTQNTSYYTPKPVTTTSSVEVYKTVWTTLKKFDKRADYLTKTKHLTHTHHSTTISTVTYNATVTITVTTSTLLTIPTPRGFIPVRNSTRAPVTKRSPHPPGSPFGPLGGLPVPPNLGLDAVYPKSVECKLGIPFA